MFRENSAEEAVVALISGGLDSTTLLAMLKSQGRALYCLTVEYGQTHRGEIEAAKCIAKAMEAKQHIVAQVDLSAFGGSALTGGLAAPPERSLEQIASGGIPATYVPARNTVFLALALSWAEALGVRDIAIGVNAVDYSGYPDCRPEFLAAFENLARLATRAGTEDKARFRVLAPLIGLSKAEIVREGTRLGVDYGMTRSCYFPAPDGLACGRCDACRLRLKGFADAGIPDPLRYRCQARAGAAEFSQIQRNPS